MEETLRLLGVPARILDASGRLIWSARYRLWEPNNLLLAYIVFASGWG